MTDIASHVGRVVWHDLMTNDVEAAKRFYADLFGWTYEIEHAADFVWKPGEADYPLIVANGEAHGGFVAIEPGEQSYWLAFVAVVDVDEATARAKTFGATIIREPFDIPGVGRSSLIADPAGARISPFVPSHTYPPPGGVFMCDELFTADVAGAQSFYGKLFDWRLDGDAAVGASAFQGDGSGRAVWAPFFEVPDIPAGAKKALSLGARKAPASFCSYDELVVLQDPAGAFFVLWES